MEGDIVNRLCFIYLSLRRCDSHSIKCVRKRKRREIQWRKINIISRYKKCEAAMWAVQRWRRRYEGYSFIYSSLNLVKSKINLWEYNKKFISKSFYFYCHFKEICTWITNCTKGPVRGLSTGQSQSGRSPHPMFQTPPSTSLLFVRMINMYKDSLLSFFLWIEFKRKTWLVVLIL